MIPVQCQIKHSPPTSYSDCFRACVASILDLPSNDVPHFYRDGRGQIEADNELRGFLLTQKLGPAYMLFDKNTPRQNVLEHMSFIAPNVHYILFGETHCVVGLDDKIVHDPAWSRQPMGNPTTVDWCVMVLARL